MKFRIADATGRMAINQQQISENFTLAKFLAIILVSTGHYFEGSLLWVPVTVGLFIFAFASGYFTAIKHTQRLPLKRFWIAKFKRLGPPIIVINLFLLALFLLQGREGIWHPHTLLGITGLSGFLNWLDIKSQSPFGAGLWFLTVLLLFYLVYPLLAKALTPPYANIIFLISSAIVCTLGHVYASPPYMLWPTVFGFCLGIVAGHLDWHPNSRKSIALGIAAILAAIILNALGIKQFNVVAIVAISIASVAFLLSFPLNAPVSRFAMLSGSILEIYLIHGYLFVHPQAQPAWIGYLISMTIVLIASTSLSFMAQKLSQRFAGVNHKAIVK